ncbi:DEKNAAC102623 [Brettanomyces naardenensis]|uniref:non-specific serine/threonine protein kinase n=1 Tax=Brettanomyces naardenensis TaxID=13370 RepID=A0A448YKZ9_BRENA|nr:DEKNAAC102623 [Brettanomyces naardenensis]
MTLISGLFNRSPKNEANYIDELSRDVESLRFGPNEAPVKSKAETDNNSFMSICSSPKSNMSSSPRHKITYNKENTAPSTPSRQSLIPQIIPLYATPKSSQVRSPRIDKEFYAKANSPKVKRLVTVCQMYFLDYYCDLFDYVIGRRERIKQVGDILKDLPQQERALQWKNYVGRERAFLRKKRTKPRNRDFHIVTQVGQGGYGQVFLARKKDTKEICALKVLNKKLLTRTDETRHVLTERDILTNTRSEWLVKLFYAFQDTENVYMAMEFVPGGDFRTLLNNAGYLIPQHARFYISEMFAAVNSLHQLGYTHRDLKPENFLIDAKGHIKLTDFGLAAGSVSTDRIESMKMRLNQVKDLEYKPRERTVRERQEQYRSLRARDIHYANSIVGSPDYMALEVLEGKPYDYSVDYWSLGCMLFEALVGYTPFSGSSSDETYKNLKSWKQVLKRPRYEDGRYVFSDRTWQLITRLIATPNERLRNFKQVMAMPYFAEVNWETLRERIPPFTPQLDNEEDAGYFDDFSNEDDMAKYKDVIAKRERDEKMAQSGIKADQKSFVGFTFKHKGNPGTNSGNILSPILLNGRRHDSEFGGYNEPFGTLY